MRASTQPDRRCYGFLEHGDGDALGVSYADLDALARGLAVVLRQNAEPGDRALLLYPPGVDYVVGFWACLYSGIVAVPAYPPDLMRLERTVPRLVSIVEDCGAKLVLSNSLIASMMPMLYKYSQSLAKLVVLATDEVGPGDEEDDVDWRPATTELAFLQYTSGSTSTPKGVMVTHGNLMANEAMIQQGTGAGPESVGVSWLPFYHDMGLVGKLLQPVYAGFPMYLMSPLDFLQRPARWVQAVHRYRATISGGPNFAYDLCVRKTTPETRAALDLSTWRVALNGAEPVRAATLDRFAEAFAPSGFNPRAAFPCYGLAEGTLYISGEHDQPGHRQAVDGVVSCGVPSDGQRVVIADPDTLKPVPDGTTGEICLGGANLAAGYWNRDELTAEVFEAPVQGEGPMLRTGDLGFVRDGRIFISGRIKDLIIVRGQNHYPQDIEHSVETSGLAVRPGCTVAVSTETQGVVVAVEARSALGDDERATMVDQIIIRVMSAHELALGGVVILPKGELPKTSSGKVQRHKVREGVDTGTLEEYFIPAWSRARAASPTAVVEEPVEDGRLDLEALTRNGKAVVLEGWLSQRLAKVAGIGADEVDLEAPIAVFGVDSLEVTLLVDDLEAALGRSVPLNLPFDQPTIRQMADHLATELTEEEVGAPAHAEHEPARFREVESLRSPRATTLSSPGSSAEGVSERPDRLADSIAIIGFGCRLPGVDDGSALWSALIEGVDAVSMVPSDRWDADAFYDPSVGSGLSVTRQGGFLPRVDGFDARFFGVSPAEARSMDPQQRLVLQVAWQALENAGQTSGGLTGSQTGIYLGISNRDYTEHHAQRGTQWWSDPFVGTGNAASTAAGRLSHVLGTHGPAVSLDTSCSSSLVALHFACQGLRTGETNLAMAGGVNLMLSPSGSVYFSSIGALSPDGRCKAFDASADGFGRAEGCSFVVLKRYADAVRDGDHVVAVIRSSAINHDGKSFGLTTPNGTAQRAVIEKAMAQAGVQPSEIGYVEAHGTGTRLGDPIEMAALVDTYGKDRPAEAPLLVGSGKSNFGHLEAAAGVTGLLRAALSLRHEVIPPHLHLEKPSPLIRWDEIPVRVPTTPEPWCRGDIPRLAAVSSFGMSGTNAHVILEEAPRQEQAPQRVVEGLSVFALSAPHPEDLVAQASSFLDCLRSSSSSSDIREFCAAATVSRGGLEHRAGWVVSDREQLVGELEAYLSEGSSLRGVQGSSAKGRAALAWLFSGQGTPLGGVARELYLTWPVFRASMDEADAIASLYLDRPLLEPMLAQDGDVTTDTEWVQPALFSFQVSLARLWRSWGVEPDVVVGHSVGELAAAWTAGVVSFEDGLRLATERGRLMQACPPGAMLAVAAEAAVVEELIAQVDGELVISAVNTPGKVVLSGDTEAIRVGAELLGASGVGVRPLAVSHAFHSPLMDPAGAPLRAVMSGVQLSPPQIPMISSMTGELVGEEIARPEYWVDQLLSPVRFADAMGTLGRMKARVRACIELGPRGTLLAMHQRVVKDPGVLRLPSTSPRSAAGERILRSLVSLHVNGISVDWERVQGRGSETLPSLPPYRFHERSYWVEVPQAPASAPLLFQLATPEENSAPIVKTARRDREVGPRLREIIADLLHYDASAVSMETPFIELGVDSLMLVEGVQRIQVEFGVRVALSDILNRFPRPVDLARHLAEQVPGRAGPSRETTRAMVAPVVETTGAHRAETVEASTSAWTEQQRAHIQVLADRLAARLPSSKERKAEGHSFLADVRSSAGFRAAFPATVRGEWLSLKQLCYPVVATRSRGSRFWDIDDNEYIDFTMGFGVHLFGHTPPFIAEALTEQISRGLQIGPQGESANDVAALVCELTKVDRVAFCNTGSEAVMNALRVARAATGRPRVAMFAGAYHGSFDGVLAPIPRLEGCAPGMYDDVLVLEYGSEQALRTLAAHAHELAAVIVEPVQSRRPDLQPREFLHQLRAWTRDADVALIFDEVMVGFRLAQGGAQAWYGIEADIVTYGKIVGGGMPIGLLAGDARWLDCIDGGSWVFGDDSTPQTDTVWFAGTFNKNPVTLAAAHAALTHMKEAGPTLQEALNAKTDDLAIRLNGWFADNDVPIEVVNAGSLFRFKMSRKLDLLFAHLLDQGVYVWEGRTMFLSTAHSDADVDVLVGAIQEGVRRMEAAGFLDEPRAAAARKRAPQVDPTLRLLCLSYAGGGTSWFRRWTDSMPLGVDIRAVDLPGRSLDQGGEGPDFDVLIDILAERLAPELDLPYALYGHSMGGLIAWRLGRALAERLGREPEFLIVSGEPAPQSDRTPIGVDLYSQDIEAIRATFREHGFPVPATLSDEDVRDVLLPRLRADMATYYAYGHTEESPVSWPLIAVCGDQDKVATQDHMSGWREHTEGAFTLVELPGDHFFVRSAHLELMKIVREIATPWAFAGD